MGNAPGTFVSQLPEVDVQTSNEYQFSRKHIDGYLRAYLLADEEISPLIDAGEQMLIDWLAQEHTGPKRERLDRLDEMSLRDLVLDVFVGTTYCTRPELFVSVTAQLACRMGFDEHSDNIRTMAEIVAVLCHTDVFTISKEHADASLYLHTNVILTDALADAIERSIFIPPMVCPPKPVTTNFESPYQTFNDSLMLGRGNDHSGDMCLDVINTQNAIPLALSTEFLSTCEEEPTYELDTIEKRSDWARFKNNSYYLYSRIAKQGNRFYLGNKNDKRGRMYCEGYHITTQGSCFKKAMIEFADEEYVEGVPT